MADVYDYDSVFPNPVIDKLYFQNKNDATSNVKIIDLFGREYTNLPIEKIYLGSFMINCESLRSGVYMLVTDNKTYKFIKQ